MPYVGQQQYDALAHFAYHKVFIWTRKWIEFSLLTRNSWCLHRKTAEMSLFAVTTWEISSHRRDLEVLDTLNNIKFHIVAVFSPRRLIFCSSSSSLHLWQIAWRSFFFSYRRERPVLSSWLWSLSHDLPAAGKVLSKRRFRSSAKVL